MYPVIRRNVPSISLPRPSPENLLTGWSVAPPGGPTALCRSAPTRVRFFRSGNRRLCVGPRTGKPSYAVHGHRPICGVSFSLAFMVQPKYRRVGWLLTRPNGVVLSRQVAQKYGLAVGDRIALQVKGAPTTVTLVGLLTPADEVSNQNCPTLSLLIFPRPKSCSICPED